MIEKISTYLLAFGITILVDIALIKLYVRWMFFPNYENSKGKGNYKMDNIKFVQTDDLINELLTRFGHYVFCGVRESTKENKNINWRYKGSFESVALLIDFLKQENFQRWVDSFKLSEKGEI